MKKKYFAAFVAIVLAHAFGRAIACPSAWIINGSGSPPTVTQNVVEIMVSGWSGDSWYINGNWAGDFPWDPPNELWQWPIQVTLSNGNHTVYSTADAGCVQHFTVAAPTLPANQQNVYRRWWWANQDHFHTLSQTEGNGWATYEGVGFKTYITPPDSDTRELYRCWWYSARDHLVSTDPACEGLTYEGSYGWVSTIPRAGHVPLYRFYHNASSNHLATTNYAEGVAGWTYQGVLGYVPE